MRLASHATVARHEKRSQFLKELRLQFTAASPCRTSRNSDKIAEESRNESGSNADLFVRQFIPRSSELFFGLTRRNLQPELLDQPGVPEDVHRSALKGLERVNLICGTSAIAWNAIEPLARRKDSWPLEVLDIACGGGDVLQDLRRRAARAGAKVSLTGYDMSETAIEYARESASSKQVRGSNTDIDFQVCNIFENFPKKRFDVVMCSLFLHHLDEEHAVRLLRIMSATARRLVLVNDLIRSDWGYAAAQIVLRLISRNRIVLADGPQSVAGAFKLQEVRRLLRLAEIPDATLRKIWPFRFMLSWSPQANERGALESAECSPAIRVVAP